MGVFRNLYIQVLVGMLAGVAVGLFFPEVGVALKPLADGFIKLVKIVIAPVIFCTVAGGIAQMRDIKTVGRVGGKTLIYFEAVSTLALAVGLIVGELLQPGRGLNIDPATLDPSIAAGYAAKASHGEGLVAFLLHLIPDTVVGPFAQGDLLQVLLVSVLVGFACTRAGELGQRTAAVLNDVAKIFFGVIHIVVRLAPLGALGAMGFTIGKYGLHSLVQLGALVGCFYLTAILFVVVVLGAIARLAGFSIFKFLRYIREELLVVLGTGSSESALPQLMEKLVRLGASRSVTGLVVPTGFSFNVDGTNIYMTLATLFLAQATNTPLTLGQELTLLGVAMLTSKGASGVTGAGFIVLAATLAAAPQVPTAALAILVGIDRFMGECRALTNFVGNGVAALVVARWEGQLDTGRLQQELDRGPSPEESAGGAESVPRPPPSAPAS